MTYVPKYVLYVLHFSIWMGLIFDWAQIISNKIAHRFSNFVRSNRFFMTSYLIFMLVHCNTFEDLPLKGDVNFEVDLVQCWHLMLFKHKESFYFYQVQDCFIKRIRHMLIGRELDRLTYATMDFLKGKGVHAFEEIFTYISIFGF